MTRRIVMPFAEMGRRKMGTFGEKGLWKLNAPSWKC